ncbi:MAG: prephenate dehydrogenase/arogenate dehydrogenase family protein, partial [Actinobacteria bacterium]
GEPRSQAPSREQPPSPRSAPIGSLAVVGTGLLGSSVALAAQRAGVAEVAGWDAKGSTLREALGAKAIARAAASLRDAVGAAELVVVAVPVGVLVPAAREVLEAAPESATVTDVGSTKASVVGAAVGSPRFVGGHPICGSETRGAENASAGIFEGATWFLTPIAHTDPDAHARARCASTPRHTTGSSP